MLNISKLISEYNTPQGIVKILDNMDIITLNHSVRVCEISKIVEKELFKDKKLSEAGLYHDIGKYFITPNLLNKRVAPLSIAFAAWIKGCPCLTKLIFLPKSS